MKPNRILLSSLGLFFAVLLVYAVGVSTKVYLGDESFHFRYATYFFKSGRPLSDPGYSHVPQIAFQFTSPVFWYYGLASFWKLFHSMSPDLAQLYQVFFYILLLVSIYLLGRTLGLEKNQALLGSWFAVSCPMAVAFSVILYLDIPAAALSALTFLLVFRKKYFIGGIAYGALILTKEYGFLFGPGLLAAVLFLSGPGYKVKIKNLLIFFGTALLGLIPDILFRYKHFGFVYYSPPYPQFVNKELSYWYVPASLLHDPLMALGHLGIAMPAGLIAYFFYKNRRPLELIILFSSIFFCLSFGIMFYRTLDMRYFMPAVCILGPLAAYGVSQVKSRFFYAAFYLLFSAQILATCGYVYGHRQIPAGIEQGFDFIREKLPAKKVVMYPAENIMNYTGHPFVWLFVPHMQDLFWGKDPQKAYEALKEASVSYLVIPKDKIYDDAKVRHTGGYPKSFVDRLNKKREFIFLKQVYDNPEMTVWEVQPEKMK